MCHAIAKDHVRPRGPKSPPIRAINNDLIEEERLIERTQDSEMKILRPGFTNDMGLGRLRSQEGVIHI